MTYCISCEKEWPADQSMEFVAWPCPTGCTSRYHGLPHHMQGPFCPNRTCAYAFEASTKIVGTCLTVLNAI